VASRATQYCLRLPPELYRDAVDLSLVFDMSLNRFLTTAVEAFVASQLREESTMRALERVREARNKGLVAPTTHPPSSPEDGPPRRRPP